MNEASHKTFGLIGDLDELWERTCGDGPKNAMRIMFHPEGMRPHIANWEECAPMLIARLYREAAMSDERIIRDLLEELLDIGEVPARWRVVDWDRPPPPIMPVLFGAAPMQIKLFSMISTFGTAQDVTTDELRVEMFFPADQQSAALLQQLNR